VQDYLEQTADKEFIRKFYKVLISITILDPTCGSGAFLFAALNILEPLYEVCLQRMLEYHNENPKGNKDFEDYLLPLLKGEHPSHAYYIFKTIILNNLYGVDLMKEAVEIAKLRLFLKLVAEVDPSRRKKNFGLEPLPDIDFNIRSGNTLVGFASEQQLEEVVKNSEGDLIYKEKLEELKLSCGAASASFKYFKEMQIAVSSDSFMIRKAKQNHASDIVNLNEKLNRYLADTYGLGAKTQWKSKKEKEDDYKAWKDSHQPFHWFAEFHGIISKGGFDVVIGNPPYVEIRNIGYKIKNYQTESCGNLYANSYERALLLSKKEAFIGFIIPVASICTDGYSELQKLWINHGSLYTSCYNDRPGKLFDGLEHIRLSIVLLKKEKLVNSINSTKYNKWNSVYRDFLFDNLIMANVAPLTKDAMIPKIGDSTSYSIFEKIYNNTNNLSQYLTKTGKHKIFYTRKLSGFVQILDFIPKIKEKGGKTRQPSELKELLFNNKEQSLAYLAILNSSIFYWILTVWSDCRKLNQREIQNFPFDISKANPENIAKLNELSLLLMKDIQKKSLMREMSFKNVGTLNIQCIYPKLSKPIIDQIDKVLAKHYGFTEEELDFIINYDIKYRMGGELEEESKE
jgi:methylase of polypeptide subunit release factors